MFIMPIVAELFIEQERAVGFSVNYRVKTLLRSHSGRAAGMEKV